MLDKCENPEYAVTPQAWTDWIDTNRRTHEERRDGEGKVASDSEAARIDKAESIFIETHAELANLEEGAWIEHAVELVEEE